MAHHIRPEHATVVADGIRGDNLRMSHAVTLQKLYLSRTNERHLERQLTTERQENDRLRARVAELREGMKADGRRVSRPTEAGGRLTCSSCGQPVDAVPETMRPRYQFCRWCGVRIRRP